MHQFPNYGRQSSSRSVRVSDEPGPIPSISKGRRNGRTTRDLDRVFVRGFRDAIEMAEPRNRKRPREHIDQRVGACLPRANSTSGLGERGSVRDFCTAI